MKLRDKVWLVGRFFLGAGIGVGVALPLLLAEHYVLGVIVGGAGGVAWGAVAWLLEGRPRESTFKKLFRRGETQGFTLVEMLIVMAIVLVLATMAVAGTAMMTRSNSLQ